MIWRGATQQRALTFEQEDNSMKIYRDGTWYKLTSSELSEAYTEKQHDFDREDVDMVLDEYTDDYTEDEFLNKFGMTFEFARAHLDRMADYKRDFQDNNSGWREAVILALEKLNREAREQDEVAFDV